MKRLLLLLSLSCIAHSMTLKQVQVITRHGARTPFTDLPNSQTVWTCKLTGLSRPDHSRTSQEHAKRLYRKLYIPNRESLPGNCSAGELTLEGSLAHEALGKYFRHVYVDTLQFLSPTFDREEVYIRSTDSPRTIASAQSQFLGFYPPKSSQEVANIIDIFTIENSKEDLLPNMMCPSLVKLCEKVQGSAAWLNQSASMDALQQQLEKIFNVTELPFWIGIFDAFYSRKFHSIPLPEGITQDMVDQIRDFAVWQLNYLYSTPNVAKWGVGKFATELLQQINNSVNGQVNPKWIYYSAHDVTVALVLAGMKSLQGTGWPPYAANLLFELWQADNGTHFVHVVYNTMEMTIPGCSSVYCPLDQFTAILSQFAMTVSDWKQQCGLTGGFSHFYGVTQITEFFC